MHINKTVFSYIILLLLPNLLAAQFFDTITIEPVTVTTYKEEPLKNTALNIDLLQIDSLQRYGNYNFTDLLIKTPGVSMLSTGIGISKPVIRGLYGNRVLILLSGLKFDNQQWQEEHGLGISEAGLGKVEIIKGPMSVLYGSEAVGGVINLIEESKTKPQQKESDFQIKTYSNTAGLSLQYGIKSNKGNRWNRLRIGIDNQADYSDGNNNRVLNSRFDGYFIKSTTGFQKKNWTSNNHFMSSFNRFGFIFNDVYTFITPDARYSRNLGTNPAHYVILNLLASENRIALKSGILRINAGIQSNERMENEGSGAISLNMHLLTVQYIAKYETLLNKNNRFILSQLSSFENNTNFGSRKIVPNANMFESNISAYLETEIHEKIILENGIGAGVKIIQTLLTPTVNTPDKDILPFLKTSPYFNGFSGLSYNPNQYFNCKLNIATGVRVPNLAELSSNGLHEGIFTYEIGDPNLKNEQNLSGNMVLQWQNRKASFSFTPFYNQFFNFIYLAPTQEQWFGFPVNRYLQQNATQYGGEAVLQISPGKKWNLNIQYSGMKSYTANGNFLPYTPSQKISSTLTYSFLQGDKNRASVYCNSVISMAQNQVYIHEIATPLYTLINAGINWEWQKRYRLTITGTNLSNEAYYDNLSRFKNFGLFNTGRNFILAFKYKF